jgi:large subunit ribosomal protein L24
MTNKITVKKGDKVMVISGKDKGRRGKVQRVLFADAKVIVDGLNLAKKHTKPTKANPQGGVIDKGLPLPVGKVQIICSGCEKPTRVRRERSSDGVAVRICRLCGRTLD